MRGQRPHALGAAAAFAGALVCLFIPGQRLEEVADLREEAVLAEV